MLFILKYKYECGWTFICFIFDPFHPTRAIKSLAVLKNKNWGPWRGMWHLGSNPGAHFRRDFPPLSVKKRDRGKTKNFFYRVTFAIVIIDISNFLQYVICGYVCFSWDKHYITVTRVKCFPSWIEVSSTKEHWLSS